MARYNFQFGIGGNNPKKIAREKVLEFADRVSFESEKDTEQKETKPEKKIIEEFSADIWKKALLTNTQLNRRITGTYNIQQKDNLETFANKYFKGKEILTKEQAIEALAKFYLSTEKTSKPKEKAQQRVNERIYSALEIYKNNQRQENN